jgi:hypothetical protein
MGVDFAAQSSVSAALETEIGLVRCFGVAEINLAGLVSGWAAPEDGHSWNDGPEVVLAVRAQRPRGRTILAIEGVPLIVPACPKQDITLYINGWRLGFWRLTQANSVRLQVLVEPTHWHGHGADGLLVATWHLPDSLRLSTLTSDGDDRELGFCFRTLALLPVEEEAAADER